MLVAALAAVLVAAVVTADVVARVVVEHRVASAVRHRLEDTVLGGDVDVAVELRGWSVLAQLVTGRLAGAALTFRVPVAVLGERIAERASDSGGDGDDGDSGGDESDGGGAGGGLLAGATWDAQDGYLLATLTVRRGGIELPVTVALAPSIADDALELTPTSVQVGGQVLSADLLAGRGGRLAALAEPRRVDLPDLPGSAHLTSVAADHGELSLRATVDSLDLDRSSSGSPAAPTTESLPLVASPEGTRS